MKTMTKSVVLEHDHQSTVVTGRWIFVSIYLFVAARLLVLWYIDGLIIFGYLFGSWMMVGAIVLWLAEDTGES